MTLSIFSWTFSPSMYLLCRNIYLSPWPFLNCAIYYLFVIEFQNTGYLITSLVLLRLPWWLTVKNLPAMQGMQVPGSGRFGEGNDNLLQYTCLKNLVDRGAWKATVDGVVKSWIWLSTHTLNLVWLLHCQLSKYYCTSLRSIEFNFD